MTDQPLAASVPISASLPPQEPAAFGSGNWHWQSSGHHRWLTCDLLVGWPHAFGSRHSYPHNPGTIASLLLDQPHTTAAWAKQVHGNDIVWAEEHSPSSSASPLANADAVATSHQDYSVWACSADCVPVLLAHQHSVAAIHSGWRGTAAAIVPKTVQAFIASGHTVTDCRLAIGPAISGPAYQVTHDVARQVLATLDLHSTEDLVRRSPHLPPPTYPDTAPDKIRLDIRAVIVHQLIELGIHHEQISVSPYCTWSQPDRFFSYRRIQTPPCPVQWSGIALPRA